MPSIKSYVGYIWWEMYRGWSSEVGEGLKGGVSFYPSLLDYLHIAVSLFIHNIYLLQVQKRIWYDWKDDKGNQNSSEQPK